MIKLNLGCGDDVREGFENWDIVADKEKGVKQIDLNKKMPFKDSYADYVLTSHVIEYLDNPRDFINEVYRIGKNGAVFDLIVDHYSSGFSWAELGHKRAGFSYFTFGTDKWNKDLLGKLQVVRKRFNFTRINYRFLNLIFNPLLNLSPMLYERFFSYILPCSEVHFRMRVIKQ